MTSEIKFSIRYTGGDAEHHKLDLYDAAASIHGLAKALAITTHALISEGEVRRKGDSIPNAKFYLHPPQKGSFVELVSVFFEEPAVQVVGTSVIGAAFWDMINFTWRHATGTTPEAQERIPKKIIEENETFIQEISDALELPLQQLHRPILHDPNVKIEINRPRVGTIVEFNQDTLNYVYSSQENALTTNILGNITKYNIISGYGRFYDNNLNRTIPFHLDNRMTTQQKGILTRSLHFAGQRGLGKILIDAKVIKDRTGSVKRYIIENAREV